MEMIKMEELNAQGSFFWSELMECQVDRTKGPQPCYSAALSMLTCKNLPISMKPNVQLRLMGTS